MKKIRIQSAVSLFLNALNFTLVLISILWFFSEEGITGEGNMRTGGTGCFRFFTNDSNILCGLVSLAMIPFNIRGLLTGKPSIPRIMTILKFIGTTAVTLTMVVVAVFLGPTQGYAKMYSGVCFELHLLCPLLAVISFCFLEKGNQLARRAVFFALMPTFLYGNIYLFLVVFAEKWTDFYGFNIGGLWPAAYIALHLLTLLIAILLCRLYTGRKSPSI
ncbi:MAG: hypothetical protein Q4F31_03355 [Eubacteriales bacterium]|nr:hypothetical protein [Eubacteriales bacterium]